MSELRENIISILNEADQPMTARMVGDKLLEVDQVVISKEMGVMHKAGLLKKENRTFTVLQKAVDEPAPKEPERKETNRFDKVMASLADFEEKVNQPKPLPVVAFDEFKLKVATLEELARIIHPEIADVLDEIVEDLKSHQVLSSANNESR